MSTRCLSQIHKVVFIANKLTRGRSPSVYLNIDMVYYLNVIISLEGNIILHRISCEFLTLYSPENSFKSMASHDTILLQSYYHSTAVYLEISRVCCCVSLRVRSTSNDAYDNKRTMVL